MNDDIILVSINRSLRINNKAVDIPLSYLRNKNVKVKPYYFHGKYDVTDIANVFNNNVIAICVTVYNYKEVIEIINNASHKKNLKNKIIIFGEYVTQFYIELLKKSPKIDFAILGDLEKPFEELYNNNFDHNKLNIYKKNIATQTDQNNKEPYMNREFLMPAFDYFDKLTVSRRKRVEYIIQTKNSVCAGKCTFCRSRKGEIIFRNIDEIFNEIYIANKKYGIQKIFFTDDNILDGSEIAVQRLSTLCDLIIEKKLNLSLKCYFKATSCYNKDLLNKMYSAGFTTVYVGLESGNSEDLIFYNKLTTIDDNNRIMEDLKNANIFPQIGFLMFNPYSTLKKLSDNYNFLMHHEIDDLFMWVSSVRIFKYTPMYFISKQNNLLFDNQEYIDYKCTYKIKDIKAQNIYNFVMQKMYDRIFKLDYDFEFMYGFFLDVAKTHPKARIYESQILKIKQKQMKRIGKFFKYLYVDYDLKYAINNHNKFLKSFEKEQIVFANIYKKLLTIYTE